LGQHREGAGEEEDGGSKHACNYIAPARHSAVQVFWLRRYPIRDKLRVRNYSMLLAREVVTYISKQLVKRLTSGMIETSSPDAVAEKIATVISEELGAEDRLNDEVRDLLSQYAEYMRREGVSYSEMFRRIKNTLISQRKVIRASGRDTGDAMKLSRDKVSEMSHKVVEMLRKNHDLRMKDKNTNNVRLEIVRVMTEFLMVEDKVDRASRDKIRTQKRDIPEGSEEWDILHQRYYSEELKKLGIELNSR
jgi:hypothetical protein